MVLFYREEYGCPDLSELGGLLTQAIGASIMDGLILGAAVCCVFLIRNGGFFVAVLHDGTR